MRRDGCLERDGIILGLSSWANLLFMSTSTKIPLRRCVGIMMYQIVTINKNSLCLFGRSKSK